MREWAKKRTNKNPKQLQQLAQREPPRRRRRRRRPRPRRPRRPRRPPTNRSPEQHPPTSSSRQARIEAANNQRKRKTCTRPTQLPEPEKEPPTSTPTRPDKRPTPEHAEKTKSSREDPDTGHCRRPRETAPMAKASQICVTDFTHHSQFCICVATRRKAARNQLKEIFNQYKRTTATQDHDRTYITAGRRPP